MPEQNAIRPLLREAENIEELARQAQSGSAAEEGYDHDLQKRYRQWYEEALFVLPEGLSSRFREQYEGSLTRPRIRQFVHEPRKKWSLYDKVPKYLKNHGPWQYPFEKCFLEPFQEQRHILTVLLRRVALEERAVDPFELLTTVSRRLPMAIGVLGRTLRGRPGLPVADEYDLQRMLHALLILHFEDVQPEETTPSRAGGSYRIDFLLRREKIAVEAKMMNRSLRRTQVRDQLVSDIFGYQRHDGVEGLFALIYDPERRIENPAGFETDLNDPSSSFPVRVVVVSG
ncbi:hypothetical protein [Streptomyces sp. URMC 129]|uniref:PD-(D/E)XK nuclease domain-containing protein n=1 Tax=Streptomyces sp. URMC 129 TaxID=3423407 RepID=UPI003F1DBB6A